MKNKIQAYPNDKEFAYFKEYCEKRGLNFSAGINEILSEHMKIEEYEQRIKQFNFYSGMYKDIQVIKEVLNTYLHMSDLDEVFVSTSMAKHPLFDKAEIEVTKRIAEKKQRNDTFRKRKKV